MSDCNILAVAQLYGNILWKYLHILKVIWNDCQISDGTLELLVVQYICVQIWKVNNFLVEVTSILDLLHGGTKLSSIWKESLYPNSYMRFGESFQKTLFTARTIHMLMWNTFCSNHYLHREKTLSKRKIRKKCRLTSA